jgi:hypothetical protein
MNSYGVRPRSVFEALGEVVGCRESREMLPKLAVSPGMVRFGEPVLDAVFAAAHVEHVGGVRAVGPSAYLAGKVN